MIGQTWVLLKESVTSFLEDEALTRGAAIAFYTVTSIGPVLFIVVAIAGIVFGEEAASGAMSAQLGGLMGAQSAELLQTAIQNASGKLSGTLATLVGIVVLIVTAPACVHRDAADPERDVEGQAAGWYALRSTALSCNEPGSGGGPWVSAVGVPRDQRHSDRAEQLHQCDAARRPRSPASPELSHIVCFDHGSVRRNLQGVARQTY
jgi:hypothetical protein